MNPIDTTITSRRTRDKESDSQSDWTSLFPLLLVLLLAMTFAACTESGLDPETAHIVPGGPSDTIEVPTLQKGLVKLGYTGRRGNLVAQDFVTFRNVTRYAVDTNLGGEVIALTNVTMEALFVDPSNLGAANPFAPVTRVVIAVPMLRINGMSGLNSVDLVGDPLDASGGDAGIRIEVKEGETQGVDLKIYNPDRSDSTRGWGTATITSIDYIERRIIFSVHADLTDPTAVTTPQRIVYESLLELPF